MVARIQYKSVVTFTLGKWFNCGSWTIGWKSTIWSRVDRTAATGVTFNLQTSWKNCFSFPTQYSYWRGEIKNKWGQEVSGERGKKVKGPAHITAVDIFLYMAMLSSVKIFPILFCGMS